MRNQPNPFAKTAVLSGGVLLATLTSTKLIQRRLEKNQTAQIIQAIQNSPSTNPRLTESLVGLYQTRMKSAILEQIRYNLNAQCFRIDTTNQLQRRTDALLQWINTQPQLVTKLNELVTLDKWTVDLLHITRNTTIVKPKDAFDELCLTVEYVIDCFAERPYGGHPMDKLLVDLFD